VRKTFDLLLACASLAALAGLLACSDDYASQNSDASPSKSMRDASAAVMKDGGGHQTSGEPTTDAATGVPTHVPVDAGGDTTGPGPIVTDAGAECAAVPAGELPEDLGCTGLYTDVAKHLVADGVLEYAPAHQLWSDGATKQRWIYLPEGTQIDSSKADDWRFPVGTKFFKEFSWKGHRVETRLFWKSAEGRWLKTAYHWNADETAATRFAGGPVDVAGEMYFIPTAKECEQCHKGRSDRALGFEMVSLGLPGAKGMTLSKLVEQKLLTDEPDDTELEIGDDGTGNAAPALAWLHVNCGVSCHNSNSNAEAYKSDLFLRLSAEDLDGRSSAEFDAVALNVGVDAKTPRWLGKKRIVAGSPEDSLLYQLISKRDPALMKDQMPPIASRVADSDGMALIEAWIRSMPAP
jgi:hypothetical protein